MARLRLSRVLRRPGVRTTFDELVRSLGADARVVDPRGRALIDCERGTLPDTAPIRVGEESIGEVHATRGVDALAATLAMAGSWEQDRRALGRETLDRYKEINLLYRVSEKLTTSLGVESVATLFVDEARGCVRSTGAALLLRDENRQQLVVTASSGQGCGPFTTVATDRELVGAVYTAGKAEIVNDVSADPRCIQTAVAVQSMIAVPLKSSAETIGVLLVFHEAAGQYSAADLKLLSALGTIAASAIENLRVHEQLVAEQLYARTMEQDLEIGRQIQGSFLPETVPRFEQWDIASRFRAARQVSGDFFDVFPAASDRLLAVVVADVCSKGVGAALFMGLFRSLIRAYSELYYPEEMGEATETLQLVVGQTGVSLAARHAEKLNQVMQLTNDYIATTHGKTNMFATVFLGMIDVDTGEMHYVNGGHEMPAVLGPNGVHAELAPTGPAVGLMPGLEFETEMVTLEPGETLVVYTDGVTEAASAEGALYGPDRLLRCLEGHLPTAEDVLHQVDEDLHLHTAGAEQSDDITMLAVRRRA